MTVTSETLSRLNAFEANLIPNAHEMLVNTILDQGEISPDGAILRLKPLNRTVDTRLIDTLGQAMAAWVKKTVPDITGDHTKVAVVESSGNMLAYAVGKELFLPVVVIKKGRPITMSGDVLSEEIHSFTRKTPTIISVEERDIAGQRLIVVDDFAATAETIIAAEKMSKKAGGYVQAICVAIAKPNQGSAEILERIPSFPVVTIEEMEPAKDNQPATIQIKGLPPRPLKRNWGEQ